MEKVLIVSGDGNLIEKLRFIFFENYGASDITSVSNPDNCITLACQLNPQLIVVDTSAFTGSMHDFFTEKNSQSTTRKIPVVFFDKGSKVDDVPQLNAVIDASLSEYEISRSLSMINNIQNKFDSFNRKEEVEVDIDTQIFNEYLLDNQGYMLNEVNQDTESGRYQYKIVETSPRFEKMMGIHPSNFQGKSSLEFLHGIKNEHSSLFANLPQDKKIIRTQQFYDSNQRYLDVISIGISENKIATFVKDITPQKKLEQELIVAQEKANNVEKLKNTFISNISHEIRTPMNAIIGFSRLLESDNIEISKRKQYVSIIQKSGFQLIETLDKILELSKIQTNQLTINNRSFYVSKMLNEIDVFAQRKLYENAKDDSVEFNTAPSNELNGLVINSDQNRLMQVLKEIIDNAIKYTNKGFVELGYKIIKGNKSHIEFYVKDTGIGIESKNLKDIFKIFNQIENPEFSKSGLGLGISISLKIIELMGGKLWAESVVDEGSTFYISIPI